MSLSMSAVSAVGSLPSTGETDPATDLRGVGERIETGRSGFGGCFC